MQINDNSGQHYRETKAKIRTIAPDGTIEEVEVNQGIDTCPDSSKEYLDEITSTVIDKLLRNAFEVDPTGIRYLTINLPFVNAGGASIGADLGFATGPTPENRLVITLSRVDDISANTVGIDSIDFSNGVDESFRKELREHIEQIVNQSSQQLTNRASLRIGYNEFIAQQNVKEDLDNKPENN